MSDPPRPRRLPLRQQRTKGAAITDPDTDAQDRSNRRTIEDLIAELESDPRAFHEPGDPNEVTLTFISKQRRKEGDDGVQ